jgi:hypothetical protein
MAFAAALTVRGIEDSAGRPLKTDNNQSPTQAPPDDTPFTVQQGGYPQYCA